MRAGASPGRPVGPVRVDPRDQHGERRHLPQLLLRRLQRGLGRRPQVLISTYFYLFIFIYTYLYLFILIYTYYLSHDLRFWQPRLECPTLTGYNERFKNLTADFIKERRRNRLSSLSPNCLLTHLSDLLASTNRVPPDSIYFSCARKYMMTSLNSTQEMERS